ncbi:unnamed protein product, partial [Mesorhabditis belari]|uniref:Uncharacterized protein n=1 Tax=Mesorhabditis belari TaxID=2138241 RepID=A0AAF3EGR3_9BILA
MSLFERAFSFLNCTRCGKLFGYNEKVLSCENRWNRNCFDYEAVCGKCMHDHAASIHVTDKQRYITEFVARRHDIEEKIRDFINKMKTKFFDGTIDCVMPEAETSKAEPSKAETSKAERSKAEPVVVPSEVAASAHDEEEDNDESNTDEEEDDDDESTYCAETQSYSGPLSYLEKVKPWIAADKARSLPDDEIREDFDDDFAEVVERKKAELLQLRSFNDVTSSSGLKIAQPESTFGTSTTSVAIGS